MAKFTITLEDYDGHVKISIVPSAQHFVNKIRDAQGRGRKLMLTPAEDYLKDVLATIKKKHDGAESAGANGPANKLILPN